jgi:hypothetical protein
MGLLDDVLGQLGETTRRRGGLLGAFLPQSAAEMQRAQDEELKRQYLRSQIEAQQAQAQEQQRKAAMAAEAAQAQAQQQAKLGAAAAQPPITPDFLAALRTSGPTGQMVPGLNPLERMKAAAGGDVGLLDKLAGIQKTEAEAFDKTRKKLKDQKTLMLGGKPVTVNVYEDGSQEIVPFDPVPKFAAHDTGGSIQFRNEYDANPQPIKKEMTPGDRATDARGWATIGIQRDQERRLAGAERAGTYDPELRMIVDPRGATAKPVIGPDGQPLAPKPKNAPEAFSKQTAGIKNLNTAINEYKDALATWSNAQQFNPAARAKMGTLYNNMMLQAKEAYNLGVLNGPDYMILTQTITNPMSAMGTVTPNTALAEQATTLARLMEKNQGNLNNVYHQQPRTATSGPIRTPSIDDLVKKYTE